MGFGSPRPQIRVLDTALHQGANPAASQKPHDFGITFKRDEICAVLWFARDNREICGLQQRHGALPFDEEWMVLHCCSDYNRKWFDLRLVVAVGARRRC